MADEGRSLALLATLTALCTVSVRLHAGRVVILSQRSRRVGACACLVRLLLGRQLLQQLEHELFAEAELPRVLLPLRPELEGVDDAHVEQPPRQTRPAALRFAPRWRRGVMPAAG